MRTPIVGTDDQDEAGFGEQLKLRISHLVDALVRADDEQYEADFVLLLAGVQELIDRRRRLEGGKSDVREMLGTLLLTHLRRGMHQFLGSGEGRDPERAATWVMGTLFSITTLSEFAQAFDQALLRAPGSGHEFDFAGRTDFISVEEVLQMLSAGKHVGCLSLEKADNRLDIYLRDGRVAFLDPHRMIRRVMPGADPMRHREIPAAAVAEAETAHAGSGRPLLLHLHEAGHFRSQDLREVMRLFGKEVLFDFMREPEPFVFYYRRLDALPDYASEHDLRLGVTSILLEGSKRVDDWRQMQRVFPDPDAPIEPCADMYARMGDVALGVIELKLLTQINGEITARELGPTLGLPMHDVYELLVRLAREGIIASPGGDEVLSNLHLSVEESMQAAFAVLDANDDTKVRRDALDKVLGSNIDADAADAPKRSGSLFGGMFEGDGDALEVPAPEAPAARPAAVRRDFLGMLRKPRRGAR